MKCPIDGSSLLMSERHSIEIDYCPECRGIWLDRGELDKILDRVQQDAVPAAPAAASTAPERYVDDARGDSDFDDRRSDRRDDRSDRVRYDDSRSGKYRDSRESDPRYRKKKSPFEFLGDLFEG